MPVRSRQIREMLQHANVHPHVVKLLEAMAEDNRELEGKLTALAEIVDKQTDLMTDFTRGADAIMAAATESVQRQQLPAGITGVHVGSVPVLSQDDEPA